MIKSDIATCFIINKSAGKGKAGDEAQTIKISASRYFDDFSIIQCTKGDDLSDIAGKASSDFENIVACGGDGTVSRIVNGIAHTTAKLGIIPLGSGNDFARAANIPENIEMNLENIRKNKCTKVDLIKITGDANTWCCNTFGMGLDGLANYNARRFRRRAGSFSYIFGTVMAVFQYYGTNMNITIDDKGINKHLLMATICNGPDEGGLFKVAPNAKINDGLLDILMVNSTFFLKKCWLFKEFLKPSGFESGVIKREKGNRVQINCEQPVYAHCDGEHLGTNIQNISAEVAPGKIDVLV
ncbi:MAG: diacylglycerol/lipid kinase family protein [Balneolaceae bacterium]